MALAALSPGSIALPIVLAVLKVAAVAFVGFLLARRGVLHETALADLSTLVIKVTVPCLIFGNAAGGFAGFSLPSALLAISGSGMVLGLGYLGGRGIGRAARVEPAHWRAVVAASTFENSAYLPIAVATAVLPPLAAAFPAGAVSVPGMIGGASVVYISLFGILYSPLFWGLGLWWLTEDSDSAAKRHWWRRLLPPPVIGLLLGYVFGLTPLHRAFTPPHAPGHFLFLAVTDIGSLTIPLANLILGGMLAAALQGRRLRFRDSLTVSLAKLVFVPGLTLTLLWLTRHWWAAQAATALAAFVVFLQATSPPATNLAVMTKGKGGAATNVTGQVIPGLLLVTYSLALVTMPLWLLLFFVVLKSR